MNRRKYNQDRRNGSVVPRKSAAELRATVGRRIARARKRAGWKQADLAEAIGCTPRMVSRYETGRTLPRVLTLLGIALALGASLDFLAGLIDDPLHPEEGAVHAAGLRR